MEAGAVKVLGLTVSGFRGFGGTFDFDLSADVVLIYGPNGSGKTSLFDSILWALTGSVERIGINGDVVSQYSEFGEGRVELRLVSPNGQRVAVTRRCQSGAKTSALSLEVGDDRFAGGGADAKLMELLWPDGASSSDPVGSLARSLTRAVYLQQDQVRSFIEDETEETRFDIVGEIVGTGRLGELVRQLEVGRKAWTTATNRQREQSLQPLLRRQAQLRAQVEATVVQGQSGRELEGRWVSWLADVEAFAGQHVPLPASTEQQRSRQLGATLSLLQSVGHQAELRLAPLQQLLQRIERLPGPVEGIPEAQDRAAAANARVAEREAELARASEHAALLRQRMVEVTEARESLATLARLALGHIDGDCPVCGQPHEESLTRARLNELIAAAAAAVPSPTSGVADAAEALRDAESNRTRALATLAQLERRDLDRANALEDVRRAATLLELGGSAAEIAEQCRVQISDLKARSDRASALRRDGEVLAATLGRVAERERALELEAELPSLEGDIVKMEHLLELRDSAGDAAKRLHDALRQLSESLVSSELKSIEPLLQSIYASVDPHPSFRAVNFLTKTVRGRGRLRTTLQDHTHNLTDLDPAIVLSSSQLNVLAVVSFMAMNLSATTLPLALAALDDPLQSLDNVNLLGLADMLRRARIERQLFVSTHDDRLAGLLERKLRPIGTHQRTAVLHFDGWEPRGPLVRVHEVAADDPRPRLRSVG